MYSSVIQQLSLSSFTNPSFTSVSLSLCQFTPTL
ncbi:hypothetical protein GBAR_LOCUS7242 [Geodia barretti]|uniref:Uncharacterized protein n=1 Tax=Geodia barretti TaxID=519541 RepID=A0AA35RGL9_GEOBA|nr:hypothetical protein GBAR_LOCUS7242 [Geodia barretti]